MLPSRPPTPACKINKISTATQPPLPGMCLRHCMHCSQSRRRHRRGCQSRMPPAARLCTVEVGLELWHCELLHQPGAGSTGCLQSCTGWPTHLAGALVTHWGAVWARARQPTCVACLAQPLRAAGRGQCIVQQLGPKIQCMAWSNLLRRELGKGKLRTMIACGLIKRVPDKIV